MDFIISFDKNTGTILEIDKTFSKEMIFHKEFDGTVIKFVKTGACLGGKVTKIDMSDTVIEQIQSNAFRECFNLREIIFPQTLKSFGTNTFFATKLVNINIPKSVEIMTGFAWNQISTIESFNVDAENQYFSSEKGFMYNKEKTKLVCAPRNIATERDIPLFEQLTAIGEFALTSTKLTSFKCTSKINYLENYALHAIFDIKIMDLTLGTFNIIPEYCFYWNGASKILLPNTITTIKTNSFYNNLNLRTLILYKNIELIEENTFINCPKLKSIFYFGSFDHSQVACFSSEVNSNIYGTLDYSFTTFCKAQVSRGWELNQKMTCRRNIRNTGVQNSLLFYVFLCSNY